MVCDLTRARVHAHTFRFSCGACSFPQSHPVQQHVMSANYGVVGWGLQTDTGDLHSLLAHTLVHGPVLGAALPHDCQHAVLLRALHEKVHQWSAGLPGRPARHRPPWMSQQRSAKGQVACHQEGIFHRISPGAQAGSITQWVGSGKTLAPACNGGSRAEAATVASYLECCFLVTFVVLVPPTVGHHPFRDVRGYRSTVWAYQRVSASSGAQGRRTALHQGRQARGEP